jgi:hypothetical protein
MWFSDNHQVWEDADEAFVETIWTNIVEKQRQTVNKVLKKKTECVVKTHDRSETFVLQGNIVIIHQSLLNSIFTTKLYILMKKINYKQR